MSWDSPGVPETVCAQSLGVEAGQLVLACVFAFSEPVAWWVTAWAFESDCLDLNSGLPPAYWLCDLGSPPNPSVSVLVFSSVTFTCKVILRIERANVEAVWPSLEGIWPWALLLLQLLRQRQLVVVPFCFLFPSCQPVTRGAVGMH